MAAQEDSIPTAGGSNEEIKRVRHQPFRNKGARPKQQNRGTKRTNGDNRIHDSNRRDDTKVTRPHSAIVADKRVITACEKTKDVTCYACGGKRHFAKMCLSKKKVHVLSENNDTDCVDGREEVFLLQGKNDATLSLPLQGKLTNILIDSGASTNVIYKATYERVRTTENNLLKSNAKIYPYGSNVPLDLLGKTKLKLQIGSTEHEINFEVIKGNGKPLIGRKSATENRNSGLLHIGMVNSLSLDQENTHSIVRSFEDRFKGTGRLKDFQLDLHVDKSVTPVAQPLRQIPFKMKQHVEDKIDDLE